MQQVRSHNQTLPMILTILGLMGLLAGCFNQDRRDSRTAFNAGISSTQSSERTQEAYATLSAEE